MTSDLDLRERRELCDLFDELGPDAPTLCEGWTTADLAAHLVLRERDPLGAAGILIPPLASFTDRRMGSTLERHGFTRCVELVRTGPPLGPMKIAPVRHAANLIEFFVHHEDVRRADGREPRTDRPDLQAELWGFLKRMAPFMVRKARVRGVRLRLVADDGREIRTGSGPDEVTITGTPGELVLELYGRRTAAQVAYDGPSSAVALVKGASFGI
jgi:uncharacterized protein (TIGR03085 family)